MKSTISFRLEKSVCDSLDKIKIKEKISRTDAIDKILKLGLEEYFNKNETGEAGKIEKKLELKFEEIQKNFESLSGKMEELSTQTMGVDLKSYRMNIFLTDFVKVLFDDDEKFNNLNAGMIAKVEEYKFRINYAPRFGIIVFKYLKGILKKNIPVQFVSEIEEAYSIMLKEKQELK
jgi:metal-responsive CopG/Arc/MetJ family transcriptional regulator